MWNGVNRKVYGVAIATLCCGATKRALRKTSEKPQEGDIN